MRHLLAIEDLERDDIERIMERAASFAEVGRRDIKKVPTLRGRTVVSLFYEASTRTSSSFELAAKRLSADVVSIKSAGSSVDKGESLKDTIATLSAYGPEAIIIRSPHAGAAKLVTGWTEARGDQRRRRQARAPEPGAARRLHADRPPRLARGQEDLDRRRRPPQPRRPLLRDLLQPRWAPRSPSAGPPTLIPREHRRGASGSRSPTTLDDLGEADVVYALRMQRERMKDSFVPSIREYAANYQIDSRRLGPRQLLMHPGPVNRGVELSPEVIDGPASLITAQVESGLVVRMAILYELLAGRRAARRRQPAPTQSCPRRPRSESPPDGRAEADLVARLARERGRARRRPDRSQGARARPADRASTASTTSSSAAARSPSSPSRARPRSPTPRWSTRRG